MAKGKKYNDDLKEKAIALLAVNNNLSYVARELGLPRSTVKSWKEDFDKKAEENGEDTVAKLRQENKKRFVENAWGLIGKCQTILEKRLDRALESERKIDNILSQLTEGKTPLTEAQKSSIYRKLNAVKVESVKELAVVLGTLYDKQAVANREMPDGADGGSAVKFEDL